MAVISRTVPRKHASDTTANKPPGDSFKGQYDSQMWWLWPGVRIPERQRQEDCKFEVNLV